MTWFNRWRAWARGCEREVYACYLAIWDARTPWYAKALAACVVAYALSPIDLIPDPIPIVGYLDDLIVVPLGILLLRRLIPPVVLAECRERSQARLDRQPGRLKWFGAAVVVAIWAMLLVLLVYVAAQWVE